MGKGERGGEFIQLLREIESCGATHDESLAMAAAHAKLPQRRRNK